MGKRKKYVPKEFESCSGKSEPFSSLYRSMIESPAFQALSASQKTLYLYCKLQYYGEKRPEGQEYFTMSRKKWCNKYHLYSEGNAAAFHRDIDALIEKGFIDCTYKGAQHKQKNVYKLSARWWHYGTDKFYLHPDIMTSRMLRQYRAQQSSEHPLQE